MLAKLDIPVKDSPPTPCTPDSPVVISKSARVSLEYLLQPSIKTDGLTGEWKKKANHGPHRDVIAFKPSSAQEAKVFLSQISQQLPLNVLRLSCETPKSSRTVKSEGRRLTMPFCHGCHGPIGEQAHAGSAIGKNLCTFLHHPSCPGGVLGNDSYRPCPLDYVPGFEQTLNSQDFWPLSLIQSTSPQESSSSISSFLITPSPLFYPTANLWISWNQRGNAEEHGSAPGTESSSS